MTPKTRRLLAGYDAEIARLRNECERVTGLYAEAVRKYADASLDLEIERLWCEIVEAQRDTFETAFTAEMLRQARAELLEPDAACGQANVIEVPVGRWAR